MSDYMWYNYNGSKYWKLYEVMTLPALLYGSKYWRGKTKRQKWNFHGQWKLHTQREVRFWNRCLREQLNTFRYVKKFSNKKMKQHFQNVGHFKNYSRFPETSFACGLKKKRYKNRLHFSIRRSTQVYGLNSW